MTTQLSHSGIPTVISHDHRRRNAALAGVAAVVVASAYVGTQTTLVEKPSPQVRTAPAPAPSDKALGEYRATMAALYRGARPSTTVREPSATVVREMRASIAGQYGSRPRVMTPSAQVMRDLREAIAAQYGRPVAAPARTHVEP